MIAFRGMDVDLPPRGQRCARGSAPGLRSTSRCAGCGSPAVLPRSNRDARQNRKRND